MAKALNIEYIFASMEHLLRVRIVVMEAAIYLVATVMEDAVKHRKDLIKMRPFSYTIKTLFQIRTANIISDLDKTKIVPKHRQNHTISKPNQKNAKLLTQKH